MSLGKSSRSNSRASRRKASKRAGRSACASSSASDHVAVKKFMDTTEAKRTEDCIRDFVGDYPDVADMEGLYWVLAWREASLS